MSRQLAHKKSRDRVREKQESREQDAIALANGSVSSYELRVSNGFFAALPLSRYKVVAIGGKEIAHN